MINISTSVAAALRQHFLVDSKNDYFKSSHGAGAEGPGEVLSGNWTPRNLVLLIIFTKDSLMLSGKWSPGVHNHLFCSYTFRDRLLSLHLSISCHIFSQHAGSSFLLMRVAFCFAPSLVSFETTNKKCMCTTMTLFPIERKKKKKKWIPFLVPEFFLSFFKIVVRVQILVKPASSAHQHRKLMFN